MYRFKDTSSHHHHHNQFCYIFSIQFVCYNCVIFIYVHMHLFSILPWSFVSFLLLLSDWLQRIWDSNGHTTDDCDFVDILPMLHTHLHLHTHSVTWEQAIALWKLDMKSKSSLSNLKRGVTRRRTECMREGELGKGKSSFSFSEHK